MADPMAGETHLVRAIQSDDLDAFEQFYRRYEASIYRASMALVRDPMTAEEVVTETFLRVHAARARLDPDRSPLPFLHRVAVNVSLNHLRRKRVAQTPLAELGVPADPAAGPERAAEDREDSVELAEAIARLPDRLRSVTVLRYIDDLSLAEIAIALDCPIGTVKSRLHQAVALLRDDLRAAQPERVVRPLGELAPEGSQP
jgi:RNA polymerase sigma-70 factor (ECF subfamily)